MLVSQPNFSDTRLVMRLHHCYAVALTACGGWCYVLDSRNFGEASEHDCAGRYSISPRWALKFSYAISHKPLAEWVFIHEE